MIDPALTHFNSSQAIDKVIGVFTGSFDVPTTTALIAHLTVTEPVPSGITESTLFQGVYSVDGGTTWNDLGTWILDVTNPAVPSHRMQVIAYSQPDQIVLFADNYWSFATSSGSGYTVMYKIALLARPDQGIVTPQPLTSNIYFDSGKNYQKIAFDEIEAIDTPSGVSQDFTFAHNLGYIPRYRIYVEEVNNNFQAPGIYDGNYGNYRFNYCDTSNVYYQYTGISISGNAIGNVFARIYYDS